MLIIYKQQKIWPDITDAQPLQGNYGPCFEKVEGANFSGIQTSGFDLGGYTVKILYMGYRHCLQNFLGPAQN